ncbi:MAG: hypothetical protein ACRDNZ_05075 [Streptosporangiaceae bacterium]
MTEYGHIDHPRRRQHRVGSWLLPVLGLAWLLFSLVPLVVADVFGTAALQAIRAMTCDPTVGDCLPKSLPVSAPGVALAIAGAAMLVAMVVIPHRGRLRWVRGCLLGGLVVCETVAGIVLMLAL